MEPTIIPIPRNEGGTMAVLQAMASIARSSAKDPRVTAVMMIVSAQGGPAALDPFLRSHWNYVFQPLPDIQELHVPELLVDELQQSGSMTGACAEAATLAAAIAAASSNNYQSWLLRSISVCAVRPPRSIYFEHVFTVIDTAGGAFLVDPTAVDADYRGWETMCVPVRRGR